MTDNRYTPGHPDQLCEVCNEPRRAHVKRGTKLMHPREARGEGRYEERFGGWCGSFSNCDYCANHMPHPPVWVFVERPKPRRKRRPQRGRGG